ncbi:hypothetical protein DPMN_115716 [Dreissena polymorpha]|uniref:Uncharacterized protein n=1 Tax=Dreissena polymorpha TaxID=45954 RepID=A0A9D4QU07_DREPO|nr:hypothetical protein DPMN_115716 [Dreissena polymorpha]
MSFLFSVATCSIFPDIQCIDGGRGPGGNWDLMPDSFQVTQAFTAGVIRPLDGVPSSPIFVM